MMHMREKIVRTLDPVEVSYDSDHWDLLARLRTVAWGFVSRMEMGDRSGGMVFGSLARGDVHTGSDIDVYLPFGTSTLQVELAFDGMVNDRSLVMATPNSVPKAHLHLVSGEGEATFAIPLARPREREEDFYRWGGWLGLDLTRDEFMGNRVPGVDKRLVLIEPISEGHVESSVTGREGHVRKVLSVRTDIVDERIRVLSRRDSVGRTGVYLDMAVGDDDTFDSLLSRMADTDVCVRRTLADRQ